MKRRTFIKGTVAAAVAAAIPVGIAHPEYTYKTYKTDVLYKATPVPRDLGCQMARALARSMMQTKEQVTANVLNRAFDG